MLIEFDRAQSKTSATASIGKLHLAAIVPSQLDLLNYRRTDDWAPGFFRPIHYIGSKLRILESILGAIDSVAPGPGRVCDLFAGSGTVSMALARSREVVCVDIQEFSRVICSALVCRREVSDGLIGNVLAAAAERAMSLRAAMSPLIEYEASCLAAAVAGQVDRLCNVVEQGSVIGYETVPEGVTDTDLKHAIGQADANLAKLGYVDSVDSLICRYFGGVYFSYAQAADLDALLSTAATQREDLKDLFLAAALSSASDAANTVGKHFAQPIRPRDADGNPKRHVIAKILQDRAIDVLALYADWVHTYRAVEVQHASNVAIRSDYRAMLATYEGDFAAVYADPPYTRDHYSRFYHVLETMCLRDTPGVSLTQVRGENRVSRGLYRPERHQSPFCIRSQAPTAFADLFRSVRSREVPLVLSYSPNTEYEGSRPRVMTIDAITKVAKQFFSSVDVESSTPISHSKLNSADRILGQSFDAERLLICRP
jgi:adenine-specific DNA-methyltransferase